MSSRLKSYKSYRRYIRRLLKYINEQKVKEKIQERTRISADAISFFDSFIYDIMDRIIEEASQLAKAQKHTQKARSRPLKKGVEAPDKETTKNKLRARKGRHTTLRMKDVETAALLDYRDGLGGQANEQAKAVIGSWADWKVLKAQAKASKQNDREITTIN